MTEDRKREWIFSYSQVGDSGEDGENRGKDENREGEIPLHPLLRSLLAGRGIVTEQELAEFISPRPQLTYDPFLLKDMRAAVERLLKALEAEESICIYGDYDADGVTSCSLLLTALGKLTNRLAYYIPSRFDEGYGLNEEAVRAVAAQGTKLLITVDCGSVSWREVELAKSLNMDVIVTDHHSINQGRAADCLLINPKQEQCGYPFRELAGCGVAFKLVQALQREMENRGDHRLKKKDVTDLLDLVAVATIGDIVPLVGENRSLVKYGLNVLNQGKRPGLLALIRGVGLKLGTVDCQQVAYIVVPHLNAAGRMLSAKRGVELLMDEERGEEADRRRQEAVAFLVENNKERRRVQDAAFQECEKLLRERHSEDLFPVLFAPEVHEGIAGIVAGKIKDVCYRPAIITTPSGEGFVKGTGRSLPGVDLYGVLSSHSRLFERFGGHKGACGFLMKEESLEELRRLLNEDMERELSKDPDLLTEKLVIEGRLSPGDVTLEFLKELKQLEPFGHQNPEPLFILERVEVKKIVYMGSAGQHLRLVVRGGGVAIECILFQRACEYRERLEPGTIVDIVGSPGVNVWNGTVKIQFVIRDIK